MQFERVIVLRECISIIRDESRKAQYTETGGPLVGYIAPNRILIVTNAAGPGPKAKLERYNVTIDGESAQTFCDRILRESEGRQDYVGDWHKHPGISLRPSNDDTIAMETMANFACSPTKHPISLIYRIFPQAFKVYVWDGSGSLVKMSSNIA